MTGLAYSGSAKNRLFGDWQPLMWDVNDEYSLDGQTLAARAWDLYRNDPYAKAMVSTLVGMIIGPEELRVRSLFAVDDEADTTEAERGARRDIESVIRRATLRRRFDAGGQLTRREMSATMLVNRIVHGDAFAIRLFKPDRPDAYQGTCWRLIDPIRVSNPHDAPDTDRLIQGVEIDPDGAPVAVHVRSAHPNLIRASGGYRWKRVPFYGPDGSLNVIHYKKTDRPDQVRGVSEFSANVRMLKYLSDITWFHVVAKKMQASNCIIVEVDDPEAAAAADRNGALLAGSVGIKPGMKYYVKTGTKISLVNTQYQGTDLEAFTDQILKAACATWNIPYDFVLYVLTGTNLSASRAALGQMDMTAQRWRAELIAQVEQPWNESILREAQSFGGLKVGTDDFDLISRLRYIPPPKISPDRLKDAQAARAWVDLGRSISGVYGEAGYPFEEEIAQRAQDNAYMEAQGVSISAESIAERIVTEPAAGASDAAAGGSAQPQDEGSNEQPETEPAKPAGGFAP